MLDVFIVLLTDILKARMDIMVRKKFIDLTENDYIHPDESAMRIDGVYETIQKGLDMFGDISVSLMRRMTLGRYVKVDEKTAPDLIRAVKEVCDILDYPIIPSVYLCHQAIQTYFCAGKEKMIIVLSDYMVENLDEDMLFFTLGNIISMFKSGHVGLATAYAIVPKRTVTAPFLLAIYQYMRVADLTSDRCGLLASQSISATLKHIMWEAGIPLNELRFLDEEETISLAKAYIEAKENVALDALSALTTEANEFLMDSMPHPNRIKAILEWYDTGYKELMRSKGGAEL